MTGVVVRSRRNMATGAAVVAATAVTVAPLESVPPGVPGLNAAARAVRLLAEGSILNIPANLLQDFANVPFNEVQAVNVAADSLFFTGSWFTPSATNIWGEDPGDPGHFMAIADLMLPFAPQISGLYQPEIDPEMLANGTAGLGQQMAMFAAAMLPVSASCDSIQCYPISPVEPITGLTGLDRDLNFLTSLSNFPNADNQLGLFSHWLQVPLDQLFTGYTFPTSPTSDPDNPTSEGIADPNPGVGENGAVPGSSPDAVPGSEAQTGFGFPGTVNGGLDEYGNQINLMPWVGVTIKFDPLGPVQQWFNSLTQPVDWSVNGTDPSTGFHFIDASDAIQALKAVTAGLVVDFNPLTAGSPLCPGLCDDSPFTPPFGLTTVDLVNAIQGIGDPNPLIQQWLDETAAGTANAATDEEIVAGIESLQTGTFTFDADTQQQIVDLLAELNPYLPNLAINSGLLTDPGILGPWPIDPDTGKYVPPSYDPSLPLDDQQIGEYGGANSMLLWNDLLLMLDPSGGFSTQLGDWWSDLAGMLAF